MVKSKNWDFIYVDMYSTSANLQILVPLVWHFIKLSIRNTSPLIVNYFTDRLFFYFSSVRYKMSSKISHFLMKTFHGWTINCLALLFVKTSPRDTQPIQTMTLRSLALFKLTSRIDSHVKIVKGLFYNF